MAITAYSDSGSTWETWVNASYATSSGTDNSTTWASWTADDSSGTSGPASSAVWTVWTTGTDNSTTWQPREITPEEREAQQQRQAEAQRLREEREAERKKAEEKADMLLSSLLTPEQAEQLARENAFVVVSPSGKKYKIRRGWAGNVDELDERGERAVAQWCIHPAERVPNGDNMVIQKLMLENCEAEFRRIGNESTLRH